MSWMVTQLYSVTSSTQEEHTLNVQGDDVMSEVKDNKQQQTDR